VHGFAIVWFATIYLNSLSGVSWRTMAFSHERRSAESYGLASAWQNALTTRVLHFSISILRGTIGSQGHHAMES